MARRCPHWSRRTQAGAGAAAQVALGEWWGLKSVGTPVSRTTLLGIKLCGLAKLGVRMRRGSLNWEPTRKFTPTGPPMRAHTPTHALGTRTHVHSGKDGAPSELLLQLEQRHWLAETPSGQGA